ncbi:FAD binding domain-containing protein [Fonsecaea pedrosoi]|nr:FAD binding domain-containing protein [Fonsecaea pedrosoi]
MNHLKPRGPLTAFLFFLVYLHQTLADPAIYCKPVPSSQNWPAQSAWQKLNETISGRLFVDVPPGAVCHPGTSLFNNVTCAFVLSQWTNSSFHANNPISADYNDDGCLPSPLAPCSVAAYPSYVVHATKASDVQAAVEFAANTGVRLIVKGTGHDLLSRSSGGQSLSIWTHNIVGVSVNTSDPRALPYGGVGSVKIAAGSRMAEVYREVAKHNLTVIAGGDMSVGIGGWVLGGGHSPISSTYGLGADQILEMEVVTPDGEFVTINEKSYPDLFWAMRGGGGSTFGVLISVTMKVYPTLPGSLAIFSINTTSNSDTFWSISTYFTSQVPSLSDKGANGYHYFVPYAPPNPPDQAGVIVGGYFFPNKTATQVNTILGPVITKINTTDWGDGVFVATETIPIPDFTKFWMTNQPETVGPSERLGSRLLTRGALTGNQTALENALRTASNGTWTLLNHLVAGKGVRDAKIPGGNNSVCPAWRNNTYIHFVTYRQWTPLNQTEKTAVTDALRNRAIEALRILDPYTGAYVNEADPTEPNWQTTFWGSNYPRLLALKKKYDPKGIFWCKPCVGNELWNVTGSSATQDGIGQDGGMICRSQ